MDTKNLLSIGEMAKISGASIYSLRYYERINILSPAYIDPESGYRYYTLDQSYFINIIKLCVEYDIPLKELTKFVDKDSYLDIATLLSYGKTLAEEKIKTLEKGLRFINNVQRMVALSEKYERKEIYLQELPETKYYFTPYERSFDDMSYRDWVKVFEDIEYSDDDYGNDEMPESGLMCIHTKLGVERYAILEIPREENLDISDEKIIKIPGGTFYCWQDDDSQIENAPEIFKEHLRGAESFVVIEKGLVSGKNKVNKVINEVKVKILD